MLRMSAVTPYSKKIEDTGIEAAQKAAKILLHYHQLRTFQVNYKGDVNLVTDADVESEAAVIQTIRNHFSDHSILSEENKDSHGASLDGPV